MNKKLLLSFALAAAMAGCINDADVPSGNGDNPISGAKGGNMEISFVVPNSSNGSRAASAEDSGVYEDGTAEEYKVSNVKLYLFDSSSKNLVTTLDVDQNELGISSKENSQEGQTIIYSCNKEIILEPGNYDILAVANGTQNLDIEKEIGQESTLLGQIDATTYGNGMITSVPGKGFIMSNRGSANLNIAVESPEKSDTRAHVRINLERAVAKLMVRNDSKEIYTLKNPKGVTYATVRLNNYKFINLANKFYTFRHVATLDAASETPSAPSSYSVEAGNFGNIADNNGYLIDPYFFDKTVAGATTSFTGGSFYTNHLSKQTDSNWSGLADAGKYVSMYCLENCMFRPAQNTVYTTGIMLKGTFTPEASQTIGTDGQPVEDPLVFKTLYYFNYKFYTTLAAVGEHGDANIDGLTEASSDADLAAKQITRFTKNEGNFSTFYNYWIKHLDNGDPTTMGVMEFGIVQAAKLTWESLPEKFENKRFYHISTDEVYGALKFDGTLFTEETKYQPHSPYSASKASSDHFVRAFHDTYGMPTIVTNCSNNYGPYQFPEKLIPLFINNIRRGKELPVYGKGENVRDWLYVEDHARAIDIIFHKGKIADTYNIGGFNEWKNIDLIKVIIKTVDRLLGNPEGYSLRLITYVTDRKGHDLRYAIDSNKLKKELGWEPSLQFEEGIEKTVKWYLDNQEWMENIASGEYKFFNNINI